MEGTTVRMGEMGGMAGAMGSLKGSLDTQKSAVGQLVNGATQTTAEIAQEGMNAARTSQMQQMGIGQKIDTTA